LTLETPKESLSIGTFSIIFFVLGICFIIGLEQLRKYLENVKLKQEN
jgi:hypothetical protein